MKNKYDVRLFDAEGNQVATFTFADTYEGALERVAEILRSSPVWDGWNAEIDPVPLPH